MKRRYVKVTLLIAIGVSLGLAFYPLIAKDNIFKIMQKYQFVLGNAMRNYVDEVDAEKLNEAAIKGLLKELDPHSVYFTAKQMKSISEDMKGSFEGIGIQFQMLNDTISIVAPIKGGPSEILGIMSGDKIVEINGESAIGLPRDTVPKLLRGAKGTVVNLGIARYGEKELLHFKVTRDKIPLYTVDHAFMIEDTDIGVIAVNRFARTTYQELMKAANDLKTQGMKKLILDLRYNPGGLLDQAEKVADEFLASDTIVYTKARNMINNETYIAHTGQSLEDIPLIVLINAGSASASEIVSGSIQDNDRGLIVGTTSFGKGLVQRQLGMPDGSAIRLTIARYYTTSGRCIQRPYKDTLKYRNLVGRLELEEGLNLEHALDKIKKEEERKKKKNSKKKKKDEKDSTAIDLDSIKIFYTRGGRPVLGGGGITPDYIVKADTITKFSRKLRNKNIYNIFINQEFKDKNSLKEKYDGDFKKFNKEFKMDDAMMAKFKKLVDKKEIKWNEEEAKNDRDYYEVVIKSLLARMIWDVNKSGIVFSKMDRQLQKATKLFPIAEKIRKKK